MYNLNFEKMEDFIPQTAQFVMITAEQFKAIVKEAADKAIRENAAEVHNVSFNEEDDEIEDYLTREETAEKLGVNVTTLWRWNKEGYLPCVKIGSKVKYPMSVIRAFIDRNKGRFEK